MDTVATTVRNDMRDFVTLSPQIKFLLVVQFIILFILSILIGVIFSPKFKQNIIPQNNTAVQKPVQKPTQTEGVKLAILPQDKFMKIGEEIPFYVMMNGQSAYAVDIVLTYDPQYIQVSDVVNGDLYERVITNKQTPRRITFSAAYDPGKSTFKKEGTVFMFKLKALKKTQETVLYFDQKGTIAAQEGKNILQTAVPATVRIFD